MPFAKLKFSEYIRDLTSLGNPIILLFISFIVLGIQKAFLVIIFGLIANEMIGSGIKFFFPKKRPNGQKFKNSLEKIDAGSFPSIHSSRVSFVYLSLAWNEQVFMIKIVLYLIILIVGYSRIFLKKHYPIDVIGGYGFGLILFYLFNFIFF